MNKDPANDFSGVCSSYNDIDSANECIPNSDQAYDSDTESVKSVEEVVSVNKKSNKKDKAEAVAGKGKKGGSAKSNSTKSSLKRDQVSYHFLLK